MCLSRAKCNSILNDSSSYKFENFFACYTLSTKYRAEMPTDKTYLLSCFIKTTAIWQKHHQLIAHKHAHNPNALGEVDLKGDLTVKWMLGE
jgi:hypothetical protein